MLNYDTLDLFFDGSTPSEFTPDAPDVERGGVYRIWLSDRHYYIGRSKCFKDRWASHLRGLQAGDHGNAYMQACYNKFGVFRAEVLEYQDTRKGRREGEQRWLDKCYGQEGCVNLSPWAYGGLEKGVYFCAYHPLSGKISQARMQDHLKLIAQGWFPGERPCKASEKGQSQGSVGARGVPGPARP